MIRRGARWSLFFSCCAASCRPNARERQNVVRVVARSFRDHSFILFWDLNGANRWLHDEFLDERGSLQGAVHAAMPLHSAEDARAGRTARPEAIRRGQESQPVAFRGR